MTYACPSQSDADGLHNAKSNGNGIAPVFDQDGWISSNNASLGGYGPGRQVVVYERLERL
jgi:hypothetical protein